MRHMTTAKRLTAAASIAGLALLGAACEGDDGDVDVDEGVQDVEEGVEDGADEVEEGADEVEEEVEGEG